MTSMFRFVLLVLLSVALAAPAAAQSRRADVDRTAVERWAANASLFVLYHEVAHLLIDQYRFPVLGREEDAADNMATWTLINQNTPEADQALRDAANSWMLSSLSYDVDDTDFYDSHGLDRQRAFMIACLMVGSDRAKFGEFATRFGIASDRQDTCVDDYETVKRSFGALVGNHRSVAGDRASQVEINYHAASGRLHQAAEVFRTSGIFEAIADEIRSNFSLTHRVSLRAKRCGEANAFYDTGTVEVIFCYEMMEDFMAMVEQHPEFLGEVVPSEGVALSPRGKQK